MLRAVDAVLLELLHVHGLVFGCLIQIFPDVKNLSGSLSSARMLCRVELLAGEVWISFSYEASVQSPSPWFSRVRILQDSAPGEHDQKEELQIRQLPQPKRKMWREDRVEVLHHQSPSSRSSPQGCFSTR